MKKEIKQIILIGGMLWSGIAQSQVRIANSNLNIALPGSSAFIDASSNLTYNSTTNVGKGLLYPRVDLSVFTAFGGVPIGIPGSFPTYYDGFVVYNIKEGGIAGVGTTQGTLAPGFWYYDNKSGTINGGTWKPLGLSSEGTSITNALSSTANTLTSTVNGVSATAPVVNTNTLSLSGSNITSIVNGVLSNSLDLTPAISTATTNSLTLSGNNLTSTVNGVASTVNISSLGGGGSDTTNVLSSSGNTMTSTVNGVTDTAPIINSIINTVSGNTLTTRVNGVSSSSVTLPQGVNIYNSDGALTDNRMVSTNRKMLWFQNGIINDNNHIAFDVNATISGNTRIITRGSSTSMVRALVNSNRMLDMELLSNGSSRLFSTGSTELFVGTNTASGPLVFGVGTNRAILATNGNFGIGLINPSYKLHVAGDAKADRFISNTNYYPDYVFENYYKGTSAINPNYSFKQLNEVEEYIKEKGHLPGYDSIEDVRKNNMTIDVGENSITNMEKIEELYLHVIELNKQIKALQQKNEQLEKLLTKQ
ncbi:autotransporter outer membrane beta-barrel domain-containing protein [Chryseobacterium oryctis]|uniref:Chaperone of endosialidase n=1 Tax=Chryseobacterium oryctis TaxID=2952618 RepID=A0ABT3HM12_9FLAO|nr:hypothetical protein [Chryseobacterium oryctis]MCW3160832.1 hypothetical protein [Chryseobacterium oryctis]